MALSGRSVPQRLGRYELLERLARGGMGTIYLARLSGEHRFEKRVAIKTLQDHTSDNDRFRRMFLDEVRIASRIDHPHVCSVIDAGEEDGTLFMVMEYCEGLTLAQIHDRITHRLPYPFYARVLADAARGLHAAHELRDEQGESLGVVHRDVSPQNIMVLRRGGVKMLDFGVARARDRSSKSHTGELKGKLAYMAPEHVRSASIDRRADVWALGVVLWEACLEYNPFDGGNAAVTVSNIMSQPLPDPSTIVGDLPRELAEVLRGALVRDPERRTSTAAAFADALERYLYDTGKPFGMNQVAECVAAAWNADATDYAESTDPGARPPVAAPPPAGPGADAVRGGLSGHVTAPVAEAMAQQGPPAAPGVSPERAGAPFAQAPPPVSEQVPLRPWIPRWMTGRRAWVLGALLASAGVALAVGSRPSPEEPPTTLPSLGKGSTPLEPSGPPALVDQGRDREWKVEGKVDRPPEATVAASNADPAPDDAAAEPAERSRTEVRAPDDARDAAGAPDPKPMEGHSEGREDVRPSEPRPGPASGTSAPKLEPGFVSVFAVPNAEVWLDGQSLGETPLRRSVGAGRHRLTLRTADGRTAKRTIRVAPGGTERVSVLFDR